LPDLIPGTEKTIHWAAEPGRQTALAIVYLHGFSATRQETAPLADQVAGALGANLFYTRFRGHGRGGDALAEASVNDWLNDAWEALAIGRRLGKQVILIGTSNGGTAASWLATQPGAEDLFALVLISPNFGPRDAMAEVLTWPWAEAIGRVVVGREYAWTPSNERHACYWPHRYPSSASLAMMGMVKLARDSDLGRITHPCWPCIRPKTGSTTRAASNRPLPESGRLQRCWLPSGAARTLNITSWRVTSLPRRIRNASESLSCASWGRWTGQRGLMRSAPGRPLGHRPKARPWTSTIHAKKTRSRAPRVTFPRWSSASMK